jgi:hypothetical protein
LKTSQQVRAGREARRRTESPAARLAQAPRFPHRGAPAETRFAPAAVLNTRWTGALPCADSRHEPGEFAAIDIAALGRNPVLAKRRARRDPERAVDPLSGSRGPDGREPRHSANGSSRPTSHAHSLRARTGISTVLGGSQGRGGRHGPRSPNTASPHRWCGSFLRRCSTPARPAT